MNTTTLPGHRALTCEHCNRTLYVTVEPVSDQNGGAVVTVGNCPCGAAIVMPPKYRLFGGGSSEIWIPE
jgi:transcription elongation factor Elf1